MTPLFKQHFQVAYIVDDIENGMKDFGAQLGISKWDVLDMVQMMGSDSVARFIANAWTDDGFMIELIEPEERIPSIYSNWHRNSGFPARFHHLGFLVDSKAQYDAVKQRMQQSRYSIATEGSHADVLDFVYFDTTRTLGHFYEMIHLKGAGRDEFFKHVPMN